MNNTLLTQIYNGFITELQEKTNNCFNYLNKSLFALADKSDSNTKQSHYLEALQLIKNSKEASSREFMYTLKAVFESFLNGRFKEITDDESENNTVNSLSLVDNKILEESLVRTNLIKKSEAAFHKNLFALRIRFAHIANNDKLKIQQLPVGPHMLIHAFEQCVKKLAIQRDIKIIMYKSFEMSVMGQMNDAYNQINKIFIENNIVPEIQYDFSRGKSTSSLYGKLKSTDHSPIKKEVNKSTRTPNNSHNPHKQIHSRKSEAGHQNNLDENYQLIIQMLNLSRQVSINRHTMQNEVNRRINNTAIAFQCVISALTAMQNNFIADIKYQQKMQRSPIEIKEKLIQQMHLMDASTKQQSVKQTDEDTIDLVGLLFQFIVEDRNLPAAIQSLLAKLQLPYLKIALQDRNIFADKNHEARKLLDKLAVSSIGWSKDTDSNNKFYNKLEEIVNHILDIEDYNHRIFEIIQINFDTFLAKINKRSDVVIKRTNERADGDAKISYAKHQTARLLLSKMQHKPIAPGIIDILLQEWSSILILGYLRFSEDSREISQLTRFVGNLIDYVSPENRPQSKNINALLSEYENGLKLIVFQKNELIEKKQNLDSLLDNLSLRNNDQYHDEIFNPLKHYEENEMLSLMITLIKRSNDVESLDVEDKYFKIVSSLKIGSWLILNDSNDQSIRAKLTWINPDSGVYLFVNTKGFKIIEKTKQQLMAGFKNKNVSILMQVALFDRALTSIADNYKKQSKTH